MSRKPKFKDFNASVGGNDFFGTVYDGMCRSEKYQSLPLGVRHFYTLCRVQARSSHGKACLYKHGQENGTFYNTEQDFVFPAKHLKLYGVNRSNASRYFKKLIEEGFIVIREQNKHRQKVNVYSFSSRWRTNS